VSSHYRPGGFSFFPPVIKNLLIINLVIFFVQMLFGQVRFGEVPGQSILYKWFALNPLADGFNFQVWQLITYQFMHGNFGHIFFNMFMLWMFGMEIENMWGSRKFLYFYLLCGVVAGLFHLILSPLLGGVSAVTLGASGAIYGVLIAFAMFFPNRYIFLYFLLPIKAKYLIGFLIIFDFLMINSGDNVARLAHLGGVIAGAIYIYFDRRSATGLKNVFSRTGGTKPDFSRFGNIQNPFKRKEPQIEEAEFRDVKEKEKEKENEISQSEIDAILDKISQSGYQNLSEREKKILFEASKRMK
jgi:membrane associated rhomboid family serine protease